MTLLLLYTCTYLFFAIFSVLISQKLGLGSVLGYICAGILMGPVFGFVGVETQKIQHIAEFGVVVMLFLVGLELAPQMLWQMRHKLLGLGSLQVSLSIAAIIGIAFFLFGQTWQLGMAIGSILALSSTAIVLQTFSEKNLLGTPGGQAGFAVLLFQDVAAIPMLALMPLLAASAPHQTNNEHSSNLLANQPGWVHASVSIAAIGLIIIIVRYLVPHIFRFISQTRLHEMFTLFTLALVVGIAALMSIIGLSPALGAFIAGVALANSSYRHEMESHLEPFKGLLLGLFFITVGAGMNFSLLQSEFFLILGMTLGLLLLKATILLFLGFLFRLPAQGSFLFALSLAQAGEFGFVLLSIAKHSYVLSNELSDRIALVIALSMVMTPLLFILYQYITNRSNRRPTQERPDDAIYETNPVLLLGHGRFGRQINSMLQACGFSVTVIDHHTDTVEHLTRYGIKTYYGDATRPELLAAAGLAHAKLVAVCIGNEKQATELVSFIHRHYPHIPILARSHDRMHSCDLHSAGADYIIRETADSALRSGKIALQILGIPPEKAEQITQLYEQRENYQLEQATSVYDPQRSFFQNPEMVELSRAIDKETAQMIQALMRGETVNWHLEENSWTNEKHGFFSSSPNLP